jgi:adenosylcobinamide kinase / adenosylcobinamide-phosphate guanylyltransferase
VGKLILLLGGARSGKSRTAERMAHDLGGGDVLFIATAEAFDDEMRERIAAHRASRPAKWRTLEVPHHVDEHVRSLPPSAVVIVDCMTLLASNVLLTLPEDCTQESATGAILHEVDALIAACSASTATWIIVSNEVGMGIVPPYRLGRLYRDALGAANQRLAAAANEVLLLVAGIPWRLKGA